MDDGGRDLSRLPQWAQSEITGLRTEAADRRIAARTALVNQHAFAAAGTLGVNGHALLGSTAWAQAAAGLDPTATDFGQQLAAKVQETLTANAWMAAAPTGPPAPAGPPRSSGEFPGGTGAGTPITEQQLAAMTSDQIAEAYAAGKLAHLM